MLHGHGYGPQLQRLDDGQHRHSAMESGETPAVWYLEHVGARPVYRDWRYGKHRRPRWSEVQTQPCGAVEPHPVGDRDRRETGQVRAGYGTCREPGERGTGAALGSPATAVARASGEE